MGSMWALDGFVEERLKEVLEDFYGFQDFCSGLLEWKTFLTRVCYNIREDRVMRKCICICV
jgi:hypothetical protein